MSPMEREDLEFHYTTASEWDRAAAREIGGDLGSDVAWVNTDRDVWHRNPFYYGPPQPHPEDVDGDFDWDAQEEMEALWWAHEEEADRVLLKSWEA